MKISPSALALVAASVQAYTPGDFSDGNKIEDPTRGTTLHLSNGLMGEALAFNGEPVLAWDGTVLADAYHEGADGGAAIPKTDGSGGYYYVSNSETGSYATATEVQRGIMEQAAADSLIGGVYSLEFTSDNKLVGYRKVLSNTALNCHGGETFWNTYISCEEHREHGRCWQVDPSGTIPPRATSVTALHGTPEFGNWEAFAWDGEYGYVTNDDQPAAGLPSTRGTIVRFKPDDAAKACLAAGDDAGKWCALESGTHDYLKINGDGTFEWVSDITLANPVEYAGSEGAHVEDGIFTFSTVVNRELWRLDLNAMTYKRNPVPFQFEPDNLRVLAGTVYVCTDGDHEPGDALWGWDQTGAYRVFHEEGHNYPAGIDFSPDKKSFFVSMWGEATYRFWREDGKGFDEPPTSINYEVMGGIDD